MTVSAGLDVHKNKCHGIIMNEDGEILKDEEFENSPYEKRHLSESENVSNVKRSNTYRIYTYS